MDTVKVIAGWWLPEEKEIGILSIEKVRQTEMYSFEYSDDWLKDPKSFAIDRELPLVEGRLFSKNSAFKCFRDSMPDRWGKYIIRLKMRQQGDFKGNVSEFGYIKNADNSIRTGAFVIGEEKTTFRVPSISDIHKMSEISKVVEKHYQSHSFPSQMIDESFLTAASAVGGARPKACVKDGEDLYIAKFPSISDDIDKGKWEHFAHRMAAECGIDVAETRIMESANDSILLSKRFDRNGEKRIHMASSMSLLGYDDGTDGSSGKGYCDIVEFIVGNCADAEKNLEELYRRVAFGICIGNCDDHFRNHSFLLTEKGWTLSPAYDLNPSWDRHHAILINSETDESDLDILIDSSDEYMLDAKTAKGIVSDVVREMKYWEKIARDCGLSRSEMNYFRDRFDC